MSNILEVNSHGKDAGVRKLASRIEHLSIPKESEIYQVLVDMAEQLDALTLRVEELDGWEIDPYA